MFAGFSNFLHPLGAGPAKLKMTTYGQDFSPEVYGRRKKRHSPLFSFGPLLFLDEDRRHRPALADVVVGMIERVIHTTYTFRRVKPIDRDEEHEFLVIDKGRLSTNVNIPVNEIVKVSTIRTALGLGHYLLLEYGAGNMTGVEPENEEAFLNELKKRQAIGDMAVKKEDDET